MELRQPGDDEQPAVPSAISEQAVGAGPDSVKTAPEDRER